MKRSIGLLTFVLASFLAGAIGCAADPPPPINDSGDDSASEPKKKTPKSDNVGNDEDGTSTSKKSPPLPTTQDQPAPTADAGTADANKSVDSGNDTPPKDDGNGDTGKDNSDACSQLSECCSNLDNAIVKLGCVAVAAKGDSDTCKEALIGCVAANGLGGGN